MSTSLLITALTVTTLPFQAAHATDVQTVSNEQAIYSSTYGKGDYACRKSRGKICGKTSNYVGSDIHVTEYGVGPRDTNKWRIARHNDSHYGNRKVNGHWPKSTYWDIDSVGIYDRCSVHIWRTGWVGFRTDNPTGAWRDEPGWHRHVGNQHFWKTHNHYYNWLIDRKRCW